MNKMTTKELAIKLTAALDDVIDGESCYDLSDNTGWSEEHCQDIIDLLRLAKNVLSEETL